jgi:hypothetical protein
MAADILRTSALLAAALAVLDTAPAEEPLPGLTYQSLADLPDFAGWWEYRGDPFSVILARRPPPLAPDALAELRAAQTNPDAVTDPLRFCRPPQFLGASGDLPVNLEVLLTPGRVTITNEGGLVRRVYTDGRALPTDPEPSDTGYSVGRWEGDTLLIETVGIDPAATYPNRGPGSRAIGRGVKITERVALESDGTLTFDVTVDAPELFTAPDRRRIPFARSEQTAARPFGACVDFDRAIDPVTGQQRFDLTPPPDLPPPP